MSTELLLSCGGCQGELGSKHSHFCDLCGAANHPFCGVTQGEEGYGQTVRCLEGMCIKARPDVTHGNVNLKFEIWIW